ncbi:PTPA-CTERM sorting domain-containing protein [Leptothermofonsia sichuanensis E412]|uniref:PTPA-CTERM sorting domain-containing protein n=1 Tax=Leptothermofonsia sichuanensis TaxID=2917832 RepID=UPI001CA701CE|nr:PTPA-CTERM sorting domain-containing protein [Leptothermofonsia sichuanensis]QZZ22774.1 PTPA-CTERM sorting domain-containing protein [Leptothermofonsia sichuanensis E412]
MTTSTLVKTSLMVAAGATIGGFSLALSEPAHALGFTTPYAPANFTLTNTNADGSVDTSGVPNSITITGGDNGSFTFGLTDYVTTATTAGLVSFNWNYGTRDSSPFWDPFGYIVNGVFTQLTNSAGPTIQNGSVSFNVALGDSFGFRIRTVDNLAGRASATISNFNVQAIPTPALLPGLIGLGLGALRKRKGQATEEPVQV